MGTLHKGLGSIHLYDFAVENVLKLKALKHMKYQLSGTNAAF